MPIGNPISRVPSGTTGGVVYGTRIWHHIWCHMAPFIVTVYTHSPDQNAITRVRRSKYSRRNSKLHNSNNAVYHSIRFANPRTLLVNRLCSIFTAVGIACYANGCICHDRIRPSVRLSVRLSVTFRCFVETNEATIMRFSPTGRAIILVSGEVKIVVAGDHP